MFYIVQVYLPEKKTKNYVSKFSLVHRHEIFMLNQYVLAWKQFFKEEGICYFHEFEYTLNYNIDVQINVRCQAHKKCDKKKKAQMKICRRIYKMDQ